MINLKKQRVEELRALAAQILNVADDLEKDSDQPQTQSRNRITYLYNWDGENADVQRIKASEIYRARRRRKRIFPPGLFGEPAWDLLLDLFIARLNQKRVSVSSACHAADVPLTTALRWLGILSDQNMIERFDSETDHRVTWVRLTDHAMKLMTEFFVDMGANSRRSLLNIERYLVLENSDNTP